MTEMKSLGKLLGTKDKNVLNLNERKQLEQVENPYKSEYIDPGFKDTPMPDRGVVPSKRLKGVR